MSEIASKANSRPSSSLTQPLVKKGGDAAHEMLFAALFGGVVATETVADPMVGGLPPVNADADTDDAAVLSGRRKSDGLPFASSDGGRRICGAHRSKYSSSDIAPIIIDDADDADDDLAVVVFRLPPLPVDSCCCAATMAEGGRCKA